MTLAETADMTATVTRLFARKRLFAFAVPGVILVYLAYIFVAFDVAGLADRARMDNARILMSDFWSHKTHVTRDNRTGEVVVAIEGENKGTYPDGMLPEWVTLAGGVTTIDLGQGHQVVYEGNTATYIYPDFGVITITSEAGQVSVVAPEPLPDWIEVAENRVQVTTPQGRFSVTRNRTETFRYEAGWELFFFTLDSQFYGKGPVALARLGIAWFRLIALGHWIALHRVALALGHRIVPMC